MQIDTIKQHGRYAKGFQGNDLWYKYNNYGDPVNVLIHGLGGTSFPFEKFQKHFDEQKKSTLILDLRGHGFSKKVKNKDYSMESYTKDIISVLESENIQKVNLVGHCFGGMISMKLLELKPEMIQKLVLISTNHKPNKEIRNIVLKEFLRVLDEFLPHLSPHLYYEKHYGEVDYSIFLKESDYYLPRMIKDFEETSVEVMFRTLECIFSENFEEVIKVTTKPCLLIHGKKDSVFKYQLAEEAAALIPNSGLDLLEDDNHVSHIIDVNTNLPTKILDYLYA